MKHKNIKSNEALAILQSLHPIACPNEAFINQLIRFERKLGLLEEIPYNCKICHTIIFSKEDLETHTSQTSKRFKNRGKAEALCTSIFVRRLEWMTHTDELDGKINCPNCSCKLGEYNWSGRQCSCGKFVTPAFQMHSSAVEKKPSVLDQYVALPATWANK